MQRSASNEKNVGSSCHHSSQPLGNMNPSLHREGHLPDATDGRKFRNKTGITQWENLLGEDYIRVHRSFVVRKESVQETLSDSLTLADGTPIPVSRKYREIVVSLSDN